MGVDLMLPDAGFRLDAVVLTFTGSVGTTGNTGF